MLGLYSGRIDDRKENKAMISLPLLDDAEQHADVFDDFDCVAPPADERFDRIVRTAMRLLEVPIAFVTGWQHHAHVPLSAHGLSARAAPHALAFCDPQILDTQVLLVSDAAVNPLFCRNALVRGAPGVRAFVGVPLMRAPGVRGGALCAMHTEPRAFRQSHVLALQDLARLAECELRLESLAGAHRRMAARLSELERRGGFDSVTGCWNVRSFRDLVARAVAGAQAQGSSLALCYVRIRDFQRLTGGLKPRQDALRQAAAHELRRRLPERGALGSLGGPDFCALLPGADAQAVRQHLAAFAVPELRAELSGVPTPLALAFGRATLDNPGAAPGATEVWARALSNLET